MRFSFLLAVSCLGLAACDPRAADSMGAATPPADAPDLSVEFGSAFRLIGTEPFWALKIGQETMVLSRPEHADLAVKHGGPVGQDGQARWAGEGIEASVMRQSCSDGMSDRVYHYAAAVKVGELALKGCGDTEAWFAP